MCLAVPGEILSVEEGEPSKVGELRSGRVSFGGLVKDVCLACVPEATVGDFVLVHAGFAITVVSAAHAKEVIAYLERIGETAETAAAAETANGGEAP
jgi:hydrogenase expression/formation protein HypC